MFTKYILIAAGVAVVGLSIACWFLVERVGTLKGNLLVAEEANAAWVLTVDQMKKQSAKELTLRTTLNVELEGVRNEANEYKAKFAKHDLATLALVKPGLVSRTMQLGTSRVLSDLEAAINRDSDLPRRPDARSDNSVSPPTTSQSDGGESLGNFFDQALRESKPEPSGILESN